MRSVFLACACLLGMGVALAQSPDMAAMAKTFGQSMQANGAALKQYSWKMRVEVTLKGDPKPPKLYAMRFDLDGKLEKTSLTPAAPPPPPDTGRGGRLKDKIKDKKIAEMKEWAGDLGDLTKEYITPSPAMLQTFFGKAASAQTPDGLVQLYAEGVVAPGDKVVYEIDPKTQALKRYMFHASLEGDPVDGQVEFARLADGPNYAARTTVGVPAKQVTATIENYDYAKQ